MRKNLLFILVAALLGSSFAANKSSATNINTNTTKQETKDAVQQKPSPKVEWTESPSGFKNSSAITIFPWTEGFENGGVIPIEWSQAYVSGSNIDWTFITGNGGTQPSAARTGTYNACLKDTDAASDETKLITPALNFSTALSAELTFYMYMNRQSGRTDALKIYYKTSLTGSWTLLQSYTNRISSWTLQTIALPNISSDYYLAFEGNAKYGFGVCVDDVKVTIVPKPIPIPPITSFPWTETFEDGGVRPSDWTETVVSGTVSWKFISGNGATNPATAHTGTYNACLRDSDTGEDKAKLISPPLDFTGKSVATLSFWYYNQKWTPDQDELRIFYRTSASGVWTQLAFYNTNISVWTKVDLDLPNLSSDYYIAFEGNALYGYGVCVDDVSVTPLPEPVIDFNANDVNPEKNESVQFTDLSTNSPSAWTWSFSPSTVTYISGNANTQNPVVSFNASGYYSVTLSATNETGTSVDTKTNYIYISDGLFYPNALQFNGVDQYVGINNSLSLNIGGPYTDRTIEAWFYCNDISISTKKQVIFEEGDATRGFNIYLFNGNLYAGGWNNDAAESNWSGTWLSTPLVFSNTWHHVALRLKGGTDTPTAGVLSAALDGIEFAMGIGAKVYAHTGGTNIGRTANTKFHDNIDNTSVSYFNGIIDEVRIWNEARTIEDIRANMYRQISSAVMLSDPNLIAYYTMDLPGGTISRDFTGNLNDGTLYNMTNANWIHSTALFDKRQSLDFDGTDDYVSLGNNASLQLTNAITVEAWIYPRSLSQWGAILSNLQNNSTSESGYGLVINGTTGKLVWWLQTAGGTANDDINLTSYTPTLNVWQHIACTFNGSEMKLYVDGVLIESKARIGAIDWSNLPIEARIGSYIDNDEIHYFNGQIDDVRIWNRALTATEIAESMTNNLWGTEDNLVAYYRFDQLNDESQGILYNVKGDYASNIRKENFDDYAAGTDISSLDDWETWSGGTGTPEDAQIETVHSFSVPNSLTIINSDDVFYKSGDKTSGVYSLKLKMYVPNKKYGYFNMEHFDAPGVEWAVDAFFDGDGNGSLTAGGVANATLFTFPLDTWVYVEVLVDLDNDLAKVYINNNFIHSWKWSLNNANGNPGTKQLGCINLYGYKTAGFSSLFYVDDFSLTQVDSPSLNGLLVNMTPTADWEDAASTNLWIGANNTDWAVAANWLTGGVPIVTDVVRIARTETSFYPILVANQQAAKLSIAEGASLVVNLNKEFQVDGSLVNHGSLSINGKMNVVGDLINYNSIDMSGEFTIGGKLINNGTVAILSNASVTGSLIDNGNVSGYGNFTVNRFLANGEKWHLISSPVNQAYSKVFLDRYLMSYTESTGDWNNILLQDVRLSPMRGFATMANSTTSTTENYIFQGFINTGDYTYTLSHSGTDLEEQNFNLIGNPYPSVIDWDLVSIPPEMDNAIYLLRPDGQYAYYANRISINGGTQYIPPGQGFWVRVKATTASSTVVNLTLQNNDRSHVLKDYYYKSTEGTANEYQLSVFASNGNITDEAVLIFNNSTLAQFDSEYDAYKFKAYERNIPNLYFIGADNEKLAIDTRPETPTMDVGFTMSQAARGLKISVKEAPNFASVVLEDLFNGKKTDLLKEAYTFDYLVTDNPNRFKLHFSFLGVDDLEPSELLKIYAQNASIFVQSDEGLNNALLKIFDMQGRMVYETNLGYFTNRKVDPNLEAGNYIIQLIQDSKTVNKKLFLQ